MCFAYSLVETMVTENKQMVASVLVGGVLTLAAAYMIYRRLLSSKRHKVSRVSDIILHPIKSGPALHLQWAECTELGLKFKEIHDR